MIEILEKQKAEIKYEYGGCWVDLTLHKEKLEATTLKQTQPQPLYCIVRLNKLFLVPEWGHHYEL